VKDKAGGGRTCTIFLRVGLGIGIAVGTSSFAIDGCWLRTKPVAWVGVGWV
jgi:hypothetical protein